MEALAKNQPFLIDRYIFLFSTTLFLSAALMFVMQPMIGKMLLPLVGGAPSGWLAALAYFQTALLAGYALAHWLARFTARRQPMIVGALALLGLATLPPHVPSSLLNAGMPETLAVFAALALTLTLPFVALSTVGPSLQRLFESSASHAAPNPYFLFAASNAGSLIGLLAYPLFIERTLGLAHQSTLWLYGYGLLIALLFLCAAAAPRVETNTRETATPIALKEKLRWLALAFIPSSLMLGVTSYLTVDTGLLPFFWVLPLALYLLTFILAFARRTAISGKFLLWAQPASVALVVLCFVLKPFSVGTGLDYIVFPLVAFFLTALLCHSRLAALRPAVPHLTRYYLWIAAGGALGGLFNVFIAPSLFPLPVEFILVALLGCCVSGKRAKRAAACMLIIAIAAIAFQSDDYPIDIRRNFYGVLRVYDKTTPQNATLRVLVNGSKPHSMELVAPEFHIAPDGFFDNDSALGNVMDLPHLQKVGIVGLGAGAMLCYKSTGRTYTAYELNPAVVDLATQRFDYFKNCGTPTIHIGDGRAALAADKDARFDLLLLDVFTSDSLPLHMLTREAFELYFNRLNPGGVIAIHVYSPFYDLRQPIGDVADALGARGLYKLYKPPADIVLWKNVRWQPTPWVVVSRDATALDSLRARGAWEDLPPPDGNLWTDDFSSLTSALRVN